MPTHAAAHQSSPPQILEVAAGVVCGADGRVLIAQRPAHLHQGGLWEFPGGKLEPGETAEQALCRELKEELDIEVAEAAPLITIRHDYPDRRVRLSVWRVERFHGTPRGLQGQPIRWAAPDELSGYEFPAANRPIVAAARLPERYALLDAESADPGVLRDRLHRLAETGIALLRLRASRLDPHQYAAFATEAAEFCRARRIGLLLSGEPDLVLRTGAAGLHLRSDQLRALPTRPLAGDYWIAASCHGGEELKQAARIGADFAVLGPVLPTATHPGAQTLGWAEFAALAEHATLPVYALGGLRPADIGAARRHGAQGIAAIRGFLDGCAP